MSRVGENYRDGCGKSTSYVGNAILKLRFNQDESHSRQSISKPFEKKEENWGSRRMDVLLNKIEKIKKY